MATVFIALGGAECVWSDLDEAHAVIPSGMDVAYGACNDAGADFIGPLTLWGTLHPEKFGGWQRRRDQRGGNQDYLAICHKRYHDARVDKVVAELWNGTSGLYVIQAAIKVLRYDRVIACGMPMDSRRHYRRSGEWNDSPIYRRGWARKASGDSEFVNRVRSMSGWTRELCGAPTDEWLATPAD